MKTRLFTLLLSFIGVLGLFAQANQPWSWTNPPEGTYNTSLIVISQLGYTPPAGVTSEPLAGDKLAAFIDGECRGVYVFEGKHSVAQNGDVGYEVATLRIWGGDADKSKPIVFKYSAGGSVYTITPDPFKYEGGAITEISFPASSLTYGAVSRPVKFAYTAPIEDITLTLLTPGQKGITMRVGERIDLSKIIKINVSPAGAELPENAHWQSHNMYTIDGNILTANMETREEPIRITYVYGDNKSATYEPLYILPAEVKVDGIELLSNRLLYPNRGENFIIEYKITPSDATNKEVTFECNQPGAIEFGQPLETDTGFKVTCKAKTKGEHAVTIKTVDGNFTANLTVVVRVPIKSAKFKEAEATYYIGETYRLPEVVLEPADADFDPYALKARIFQNPDEPGKPEVQAYNWRIAYETYQMDQFAFVPLVICEGAYLEAYIGGNEPCVQKVNFKKRYDYGRGWSWASVPYAYTFRVSEDPFKGLQEVRSENQVAFNDMKFGWFGDDFQMVQGKAYKQCVGSGIFREVGYAQPAPDIEHVALRQGWNWIATPYEYDFIADLLFKNVNAQEGDIILSKNNGMMTFTSGKWQSSTQAHFPLKSGEGYLYFAKATGSEINWGKQFEMPQPQFEQMSTMAVKSQKAANLWEYDGSRFASSMAIIGKMSLDMGFDADQYSIGAFVGNECRGEGRILENGMVLVSLSGEAGEDVTFKLRDKETGELMDFTTQVNFDMLAGNVAAPIPFMLNKEVTGIDNINGENLNIRFVGNELKVEGGFPFQVMATDGKVVTGKQLPRGVYIVVVDTPNGKICQKVVKK